MYIHNESQDRNIIDEKVELLRDFCILKNNATKQEEAIRKILASCSSEVQMEQKIHNVLYGKESLKDLIKKELN